MSRTCSMTIPATRKATIEPTPSRPKTSRQSDIRPRRPIAAAKNAVISKWDNTQLQLISSLKTLMANQFLVYQLDWRRTRRLRQLIVQWHDRVLGPRIQPEPARYPGDGGGRAVLVDRHGPAKITGATLVGKKGRRLMWVLVVLAVNAHM